MKAEKNGEAIAKTDEGVFGDRRAVSLDDDAEPEYARQPRQMLALDEVNGFRVRPGIYDMYGATALTDGVNFTVHSNGAKSVTLLLFHRGEKKHYATIPFPKAYRIGRVFSMIVFGLDIRDLEYNYQVDGPWDPAQGLLFDKRKQLLDPYARTVAGQRHWGEPGNPAGTGYRARVVQNNFEWNAATSPNTPMEDTVIYEMHVRGFTIDPSSGVKFPGTFHAIKEKIGYLKNLGVTALELMPIFEFDEAINERIHDGRRLIDYWGYNTVSFFSPNTSYAAEDVLNREGVELKELVRELHDNNIEVILDVVFNHTAEGNEMGPVISFKGFDNNIYYMLTPDGGYYNFSGCGNTMNCNQPIVQELIVRCLRYWAEEYRVDGFRFDLASILGRNEDGSPMENPPLLQRLAYDPLLGNVKLIAEAWDAGGMYQVGSFPAWKRWAEWNGRYRDDIRKLIKGDYWVMPEAVKRITGSMDMYHTQYAGYNSSVNFITCHDGFTLYDLYSYQTKHNEANGWNNTDGADDNNSWNCGVEGDTNDPEVLDLRFRLMRNAIAILMCSRGTPMILAGDEFANTQFGNNNTYCQDNEISWLDWTYLDKNKNFFDFYRNMIHFRRHHAAIRGELPHALCGLPGVAFFDINGNITMATTETKQICICFAGHETVKDTERDDVVMLILNPYWEDAEVTLPVFSGYEHWFLAVDTGDVSGRYYRRIPKLLFENRMTVRSRSVMVLVAGETPNE
ncbi:MAG: glycogen debranching protein GlgX [Lachnospiraceae bacterium]|nr:glycogen debranching protein GlgX [Lachnospiraceae bacterium]